MARLAQFGIAIAALGIVLAFMGLYPGVTGIDPAEGVGIVQIFIALSGFTLLILGALIYVKYTFYADSESTLAQQIGVRLALTGLMLSSLVGFADTLGFGSHLRGEGEPFFGWLQAIGLIGGFVIASVGVLIYALTGDPGEPE